MREQGTATLAVDEAHHLRSEWWRCLKDLKAALPGIRTLALTGTPPYDAPQREWNRYASFCGEVDEEIGVPELVRDRNLCPHQDLAYLCIPDRPALDELKAFRQRVAGFVRDLALDSELAALLATLPGLKAPEKHLDAILKDTEFWLSVAIYMNGLMWEDVRGLVKAMGLKRVRLPAFDIDWAQVLLQGLLFGGQARGEALATRVEKLRRRLHSIGVIERRRVGLRRDRQSRRLVRSAAGLLRGLSDIVEAESRAIGHRLQMVILTDKVRAADFPAPGQAPFETVKLGVVPIFEHLRRIRLPDIRIGILTGSLVVIPRHCLEALRETAVDHGLNPETMGVEELWHAPAHLRIECNATSRQDGVAVVTKLFSRGLINVLVGTAALLGEGWDAPAVNTLVLASTVATYVSSNQMRGRAIRTQGENPFKAANIWHLAAVQPESTTTPLPADPELCANSVHDGDLGDLQQRFRAFVGLDLEGTRISSGFARLGPLRCGFTLDDAQSWNAGMIRQAQQRDGLAQRWRNALGQTSAGRKRLVRELTLSPRRFQPRFLWRPAEQSPTSFWRRPIVAWYAWRARRRVLKIARAVAEGLAANGVIGS